MMRQRPARGFVLRAFGFVVVILMGMASFSLSTAIAKSAAAPATPISQASDEASASAAARQQNTRVEVSGRTSETTRVFAEPSGSFSLEQSVMPERVRRGEQWVDVDTTLETRPDGTVAPKAAAADMAFSGGGVKPLATLRQGGGTLALSWRGELPKPVVSGDTATYAEVLAGVDLRVRATVLGFGHELVVKTRAAAVDPVLAKVTFGLAATGVSVTVDEAGNARAVDPVGKTLFQAPSPEMWDSSPPARGQAEPAPVKRASVGVELGGGQLSLVPDKALMADPEVNFPLVIDPTWGAVTPERSAWALVRKGLPGQVNLNIGPRDDDERYRGVVRVGRSPDHGSDWIDRSYFRFDTTAVKGARINKATLQVYQLWKNAHSCNPADVAPMELRATAAIDGGISWNHQPWLNPEVFDAVQSVPKAGYCALDWVGLNATRPVQAHADAHSNDVTLMIKATDAQESSPNGWKRFDSQQNFYPKLFMEFNHAPLAPVDVQTSPLLPEPCHWCGDVSYVNTDRISLQARLRDPQGGQVMAVWDISTHGHREQWWPNGEIASTPLVLQDLQSVTWKIRGHDGQLDGPSVDGPAFVVDLNGPMAPPTVGARLYQPGGWHGGVGVPDTFTFRPGVKSEGGVGRIDTDIDRYRYWFASKGEGTAAEVVAEGKLSGPASVVIAPPTEGPDALMVQSVDRAGKASESAIYDIKVRPGNSAASHWALDGNAKDEALLGGRHATPEGNVTWTPGVSGAAVRLDGSGAHISAPHTVRTDVGFSVAAWVKLDRADRGWYTVVSQDSRNNYGFSLLYHGEVQKWVFVLPRSDALNPPDGWYTAVADPTPGEWTHLAGVYDSQKAEMRLYVNGVPAGHSAAPTNWNADGKLRIGQTKVGATGAWNFSGAIDEVRAYDRALTDVEVRALVTKDDVRAGQWKFDDYKGLDQKGTTASNEVDSGQAVALTDGAAFVSGGRVGDAIKLGVPNASASTTGPVVRTDRSFTVSTWLRLEQPVATHATATAVSATGGVVSSFFLGYRSTGHTPPSGKWELYAPSADRLEGDRPPDEVVQSDRPAELGSWTHVVAVYDADTADKRIKLYVNGELSGNAPRTKGFNATGPLLIGQARWNNAMGSQWNGSVDELRAYSRTLDAAEIKNIYKLESPAIASWKFDGNTQDDSGGNRHGNAVGAPTWVPGRLAQADPADKAIRLDGIDDHVTVAPSPVRTNVSFSLAAWVYLDTDIPEDESVTVIGQGDLNDSTLRLSYTGRKEWRLQLNNPPIQGQKLTLSSMPGGQARAWTHLTATYDAASRQAKLYVNGLLVATGHHVLQWGAPGDLTVGRSIKAGVATGHLPGAVDEVKVYDRVLPQDEATTLADRDPSLIHNLRLDETTGTVAGDSTGLRPGTVTGATFVPGRAGNALKFDSNDDVVTTAAADVRTDNSFSVSAWVNLAQSGGQVTAVSMDGARTSKFRLGHVKDAEHRDGAWIFEMPEQDIDANPVTTAAVSMLSNELNSWVLLTGVYDAPAKRLLLYVNGARVGLGELRAPWHAPGGVVIGRGKLAGQPEQFWRGSVDDVRLYTGRLSKDKVLSLYKSYPVPAN